MKRMQLLVGKGETLNLALRFKNSDGSPVDLSGLDVKMYVTKRDNTPFTTLTADTSGNEATFVQDQNWPVAKYEYHVTEEADDHVEWILYGTLTIKEGDR